MKYYLLLALFVGQTVAAPLNANSNVNVNGNFNSWNANGNQPDTATKIKGFEAFLYLLAPDSWITAWNAISTEGKQCFIETASDPANADIYNSDDNEKIKQNLQSKCASSYTQLAAFCDATDATMKQLPQSFLDISKSWGQQMQTLSKQYSNGMQPSSQSLADAKALISQFSKPTADYMSKLAALSQQDRQQISTVFPKLQPFFSGDHAVEFLNEVSTLYSTMSNGDFNANSLADPAKKLVTTWGTIWQQYKTQNADGLKKAGDLLGKDLTKAGDDFAASLVAKVNSNNNSFPANGAVNVYGSAGSNSFNSPDVADGIKKRAEEAKAKFDEAKEKVQGALQDASETGKAKFEEAKGTAQEKWSDLKDKAEQFKQNHFGQPSGTANGAAEINGNGASANVKVN
jgi:hypothetical protein